METLCHNENALQNISNCSENFKKSVASIIEKNVFRNYKLNINDINTNNGNYLAKLYEVDIKEQSEEFKKEINLFIKECLVMEKIKIIDINEVYGKEVFIYTNYANIANKLQSEAKIPVVDRFKFVPAYGGNNKIIILDNLSKQGFKTYYRMDVMPIKYAELAVAELAKFHALSFVIERKMPEYFENHIKSLKNTFDFEEDWSNFVTSICYNASKIVDGERERLEKYAPRMKEKFIEYFTDPGNFKKCLSHGDYRMNNILVKEMDGEPTQVVAVDYQLIDYGNPIRDFLYIIYTSSDRKFRLKHLADLKNLYHNTMTRFLEYFDLDVNDIYPREEFERTYSECIEYGLVLGLYLLPFLFASDDENIDTSKLSLLEISSFLTSDYRYKDRAQGLFDEFTELGIL